MPRFLKGMNDCPDEVRWIKTDFKSNHLMIISIDSHKDLRSERIGSILVSLSYFFNDLSKPA